MKIKLLLITLLLVSFISHSQERYTETIIGVNIYIPELEIRISTNEYGFYSLTIPEGAYTVNISYKEKEEIISNLSKSDNSNETLIAAYMTSEQKKANSLLFTEAWNIASQSSLFI